MPSLARPSPLLEYLQWSTSLSLNLPPTPTPCSRTLKIVSKYVCYLVLFWGEGANPSRQDWQIRKGRVQGNPHSREGKAFISKEMAGRLGLPLQLMC